MIIAAEKDQEWGCEDAKRCGKDAKSSFGPIVWCCFFVVTLLAGLSRAAIAQADDIGLNFDLASSGQPSSEQTVNTSEPIPSSSQPAAASPPLARSRAAVSSTSTIAFELPDASPPASPEAVNSEVVTPPVDRAAKPDHFYSAAGNRPSAPSSDADIFTGGSDSLVARAVGSAEGTRTPSGDRTSAYYGHVDPGNGVWNLGSFSYQHEARSPEDADERQLKRLQSQAATLQAKAEARSLSLTLAEKLNGIDLANQSPGAALEREGYIDRLAQAREMGLQGSEAVLWARTRSFLDPDSQRWNAPGLGNNVYSISHDQERRQQAIDQAIEAAQPVQSPFQSADVPQLSDVKEGPPDTVASSPVASSPAASAPPEPPAVSEAQPETIDRLLQIDLSPSPNP